MSTGGRRKFTVRRHPVVVDVGCSCRRTKSLVSLFTHTATRKPPKLNPETPPNRHHPLSSYYPFTPSTTNFSTSHRNHSSSSNTTTTSWQQECKLSSTPPPPPSAVAKNKSKKNKNKSKGDGRRGVVKESVAVVKESEDPYHDFRDSMLQMILEKDIYALDDLRELLHRFLSLNSPYHHDSILRAFTDIWNDLFNAGKRGCAGGGLKRKTYKRHYYPPSEAETTTRHPMRVHHSSHVIST